MTKRFRRLLFLPRVVVPFLLLVPLSVLKWRADHPPLSQMDQDRVILSPSSWATISGYGDEWLEWTKTRDNTYLQTHDEAIRGALTQTLRCADDTVDNNMGLTTELGIDIGVTDTRTNTRVHFNYQRGRKGAFLDCYKHNLRVRRAIVRGRFIPEFEALIAQLVQLAKAKGKRPEINPKISSQLS